jgi:hypothetical protein
VLYIYLCIVPDGVRAVGGVDTGGKTASHDAGCMAALTLALFRGDLSQRKDKDSFTYILRTRSHTKRDSVTRIVRKRKHYKRRIKPF